MVVNMDVNFFVVDTLNDAYNAIIGRISLNKASVIILMPHLLMKFLKPYKVGHVQVD